MTRLNLAPSEFWRMDPRHFWWLAETLETSGGTKFGMADDEREALIDLLREAEIQGLT